MAGDSFNRYADSLDEELMQATYNEIHGPQMRSSTPIDIDNMPTLHLPTVLSGDDDQSMECEAPPLSPIQLESPTKKVMPICTMDRVHKQIVASQNTLNFSYNSLRQKGLRSIPDTTN